MRDTKGAMFHHSFNWFWKQYNQCTISAAISVCLSVQPHTISSDWFVQQQDMCGTKPPFSRFWSCMTGAVVIQQQRV
jgi:hypothetical protein